MSIHVHIMIHPGRALFVHFLWNQIARTRGIHEAGVPSAFFATSATSVPDFIGLVGTAFFDASECFPFTFDIDRGLEEEACDEGLVSPSPCARSLASLSSRPSSIARATKSFLKPQKRTLRVRLLIERWSGVPR
jgi:hypothetical protein